MNALDRAPWLRGEPVGRWDWLIRPLLAVGIVVSSLILLALIVGLGYGAVTVWLAAVTR